MITERGYLGCCSGCKENCTEWAFLRVSAFEYLAHFFEGDVWILVFDPHCFLLRRSEIRRPLLRSSPAGKLFHRFCSAHNSLDWRVRLIPSKAVLPCRLLSGSLLRDQETERFMSRRLHRRLHVFLQMFSVPLKHLFRGINLLLINLAIIRTLSCFCFWWIAPADQISRILFSCSLFGPPLSFVSTLLLL